MKAAIYCRLSDEDRDKVSGVYDSVSIQNQKAILMKYAKDNDWTIYDIYSDDNYSGADRERPGFRQLISDAFEGKFNIVLCKSQSRFTRESELVETYLHNLFPRYGIRFVSLTDCTDTENPGNKKARQINGLVNEWFLEELSDNIRLVLTSRRKQGYHIGAFAPYGYRKDPGNKGHLLVDPEAAAVVRKIFSLYMDGKGKQAIARTLNEQNIPNPTEYKRCHGNIRNRKAANSGLWTYSTISYILSNEVYIGNMIQGKSGVVSYKNPKKVSYPRENWIVVNGTHEPILDQTVWEKVQSRISGSVTPSNREKESIFARKLRCFNCGSSLHSVKNGNKRGYQCRRHTLAPETCDGAYISHRTLERIVAAQLQLLSESLLDKDRLEKEINPFPEFPKMKKEKERELRDLDRQIEEISRKEITIYIQKVKGLIDEDTYDYQKNRLTDEKNSMLKKRHERSKWMEQQEARLKNYDEKQRIKQYVGIRKLTKEMVNFLINDIAIGRRNPATKERMVEIHWRF